MSDAVKPSLRILITNNTLASRAGSELYVRDLAIALMKRGHQPIAYSSILGDVADELRLATIPVIDDLGALSTPPDIIHGQHHLDAVTAMLHFPQVPALYACHGWLPWEELPPVLPNIRRYVAVDNLCRERLLCSPGIQAADVEVLYNFVDLERFELRPPLPAKPKSVLVFSNYASDNASIAAIRNACLQMGIERVDVVGVGMGNSVADPERLLGDYDLVFAKARCALEAMAAGCAVIVADFAGLGGLVTTQNMVELRNLNFGVRTMQKAKVTEGNVLRELQRYQHEDARRVSQWIRHEADMAKAIDRWLGIYSEVLAEHDKHCAEKPAAMHAQLVAGSAYLRWLAPVIKTRQQAEVRADQAGVLAHQANLLAGEAQALADARLIVLQQTQAQSSAHEQALMQQSALLSLREAELTDQSSAHEQALMQQNALLNLRETELAEIYRSRAWKAITHYRKLKAWLRRG